MNYLEMLENFRPGCEQEAADREYMLEYCRLFGDRILTRECRIAHLTASSIIVNKDATKTLMAFHNIYNSWAWTGGHCDGEKNPMDTAIREAQEETGITGLSPLMDGPAGIEAIEVLPHIKRGKFVSAHIHFNVTFLFMADEDLPLKIRPDENSLVGWIPVDDLKSYVSEEHMIPIYEKILDRAKVLL